MRRHTAFKFVFLLAILHLLNLFPLSSAAPHVNGTIEQRSLFSLPDSHGSGLEKRRIFNVDGIPDPDQKAALIQGFKDAVEIGRVVLAHMNDVQHKNKIGEWFGDDKTYPTLVTDVFKAFIGDDTNSEGADVLGEVVVYPEDYWVQPDGTLFCQIVKPDGKTGTAYYMPYTDTSETPGMHFCDKFFQRQSAATYLADDCAAIANPLNTDTIGRAFQGANVLHEFMHFPKVGKVGVGKKIRDIVYGAWSCYILKSQKDLGGRRTVENADSYVYYAMHIYLTEKCGKDFSLPRGPEDDK